MPPPHNIRFEQWSQPSRSPRCTICHLFVHHALPRQASRSAWGLCSGTRTSVAQANLSAIEPVGHVTLQAAHAGQIYGDHRPRSGVHGTGSGSTTLDALHALLRTFQQVYNHERPHRANDRRSPAEAHEAPPKDAPRIDLLGKSWPVSDDTVATAGVITLRGRAH